MKLAILILYFAVLIGIGLYCRKHTTDVNGFVLGGRSVGPWLTAFAYEPHIFLPLSLSAMPDNLVGNMVLQRLGPVLEMR